MSAWVSGAAALCAVVLLGAAALSFFELPSWSRALTARIALAHLAGSALMTWIVTALAVPDGRVRVFPVYFVLVTLLLCSARRLRSYFRPSPGDFVGGKTSWWIALPGLLAGLGLLNGASGFLFSKPLILGDTLTMWALKPKVLFFTGSIDSLPGCCAHPPYPLLVPLQSWWMHRHMGFVSEQIPELLGFIFLLDTVVVAYWICRSGTSAFWAMTAAALLAADPDRAYLAAGGMADPYIAPFFLACAAQLQPFWRGQAGTAGFAVLMAAGALQTKNEGSAWALLVVLVLMLAATRRGAWRQCIAGIAVLLAAAAPWVLLRVRLHIQVFDQRRASMQTLASEWGARLWTILERCAFPGTPFLWFYVLVLVPLGIVLARRARVRFDWLMPALAALQYAAYLATVFQLADVGYELTNSERVFSQVSPLVITTCMMACFPSRRGASVEPAEPRVRPAGSPA